jgi:hypothetical protein
MAGTLYDSETLDAVSVVALDDYYPTQIRSLLALWRVSGQQFGLEANTIEQATQQASDSERRIALVKAVQWWKQLSSTLNAAAQVSVQTTNKVVLGKALRCRVEMIRLPRRAKLIHMMITLRSYPVCLILTGTNRRNQTCSD